MKRTSRNYLLVGPVLLLVLSFTATTSAQDARTQAEPLIRTAIYESGLATLTGDVKLYRSHLARRTFELYRLIFEGFKEVPDYAAMLKENNVDTADKFIDSTFKMGASQWANLSKDEIEQRARSQSNGKLTFLNDQEAILEFGGSTMRIVFEDKAWKIDETEAGKKIFLENFQFTAATKARIEKL
jgi:hypothetical protein